MAIEVGTIDGPSYFASAIINGDLSGLSDEEESELDSFLAELPENASIVSCEEETFFGRWNGIGHDMVTYTYLIHKS